MQHIGDVQQALSLFSDRLQQAGELHDYDKLTRISWFHSDFVTNFKETGWWDNHRHIHRHHLAQPDGIPTDVNLLDVLEYIADCVMAGVARTGAPTPVVISPVLLTRAFHNTVELLKSNVTLDPAKPPPENAPKPGALQMSVGMAKQISAWLEYERDCPSWTMPEPPAMVFSCAKHNWCAVSHPCPACTRGEAPTVCAKHNWVAVVPCPTCIKGA